MSIADHTVLHMNALRHCRMLTVRTLTDDGESRDSIPVLLSDVLKKVNLFLFVKDQTNLNYKFYELQLQLDMETSIIPITLDDNDNDSAFSLTLRSDDENIKSVNTEENSDDAKVKRK